MAGTSSWSGGCGARAATEVPRHAGLLLRPGGCGSYSGCGPTAARGTPERAVAANNGCDWTAMTCAHAAYGGHLAILQWLRAEGCPWNKNTGYHAVTGGHVEVLRWARANGCPWDAATRDRAAAGLGYTDDLGNLVA